MEDDELMYELAGFNVMQKQNARFFKRARFKPDPLPSWPSCKPSNIIMERRPETAYYDSLSCRIITSSDLIVQDHFTRGAIPGQTLVKQLNHPGIPG